MPLTREILSTEEGVTEDIPAVM